MPLRSNRLIPSLLVLFGLVLGGCASPPSFAVKRLIVVGDSTVDNGNLLRITGGKVPAPPNWRGRNTNGPTVVEYVAKDLGAELMDYAVSGATSGRSNIVPALVPGTDMASRTGLLDQIDGLSARNARFRPGDTAIIWAGSNDIFGVQRKDRDLVTSRIAASGRNIEESIRQLNAMGVTRFVVANRTPREALDSENDLNGKDLNREIALAAARAAAATQVQVQVFDAYDAVAEMMSNPSRYGISEPRSLCIQAPACAAGNPDHPSEISNTYVNWDASHKTTRVHRHMADKLLSLLAR